MHLRVLLLLLFLLAAAPLAAQEAVRSEHSPAAHPSCLTPRLLQQNRHALDNRTDTESAAGGNRAPRDVDRGRRDDRPPAGVPVAAPVTRETRQREQVSKDGHFRIHYDLNGGHAVAPKDLNANGVPDYIDSVDFYLEYAWQVEIVEMGFKAPTDKGIQGPEIDVFVSELDDQAYGYAYPEFENEISSSPLRITGFLVLDNDYAGFATPGIAGLRVTTAHELHHIIQFSSYRLDTEQLALYEATATWFEKMVHPALKDYRNYTDIFLRSPHQYPFSTHQVDNFGIGYGHVLYMTYLSERIGPALVRAIWEEFELDGRSFTAIDNALLAGSDLNLERSWCEFARWCYHTGRRAPRDSSMLDEAASLPTMGMADQRPLETAGSIAIRRELQPLSFALERVLIRSASHGGLDTVDFLVSNTRSDIGSGGPGVPRELFTLTVSSAFAADFVPIVRSGSTIGYYSFASSSPFYCLNQIGTGISSVSTVESDNEPAPVRPRSATVPENRSKPMLNLQGD